MSRPASSQPTYGLLLDVDGPIASPIDRAITRPSIIPDLIALMSEGVPVIFNTGRSDEFLREYVVAPLIAAGLPDNAEIHGVCEKGAVWFEVGPDGVGELQIDRDLALPAEFAQRIQELVSEKYDDTMFFDRTKYAMVSVEQHVHVSSDVYLEAQRVFDADVIKVCEAMNLGVRLHDLSVPDTNGEVPFRIDPTIISTDIESVILGKDRGAQRALELLSGRGELPELWRTVGDSRTDYAMADWLHFNRYQVAHIDVRPADGVPEKPYPILAARTSVNDYAGAKYLSRLRSIVEGELTPDLEAAYDA